MIGDGKIEDQKKVFLAMQSSEQMGMIFEMIAYVRSEITNMKKEQIEYRKTRERKEDSQTSTQDKINAFFLKRFAFWIDLASRVLSNVITAIILALLGLAFGVIKLP